LPKVGDARMEKRELRLGKFSLLLNNTIKDSW
jgi:hypothetical protein